MECENCDKKDMSDCCGAYFVDGKCLECGRFCESACDHCVFRENRFPSGTERQDKIDYSGTYHYLY